MNEKLKNFAIDTSTRLIDAAKSTPRMMLYSTFSTPLLASALKEEGRNNMGIATAVMGGLEIGVPIALGLTNHQVELGVSLAFLLHYTDGMLSLFSLGEMLERVQGINVRLSAFNDLIQES